jgi:transcriptional regulator with XRE-family HTH domain
MGKNKRAKSRLRRKAAEAAEPAEVAEVPHPLREFRLRRGLTQRRFARMIGWPEQVLSDIERGAVTASERYVALLAELMGLSFSRARALCDGALAYDEIAGELPEFHVGRGHG